MSGHLSLRQLLATVPSRALQTVRGGPVACGLLLLGLLVPNVVGDAVLPMSAAIPLLIGQLAALLVGWTGLLRAAQGQTRLTGVGLDSIRVLGASVLNSLFLALIAMILGLVLIGTAGATGLGAGDDLTMVVQSAAVIGGWKAFVLLALEVAALLLMLTLTARLLPAGPASVAERRVISLAVLGWTRGSGMKPAAGLVAVLLPSILLALSALLLPNSDAWIDWIWAGVLAFIQFPLLAAFSTTLWHVVRPEGVSE